MHQLRNLQDLTGFTLDARDGEIGKVEDWVLDDDDWSVAYIVADKGVPHG